MHQLWSALIATFYQKENRVLHFYYYAQRTADTHFYIRNYTFDNTSGVYVTRFSTHVKHRSGHKKKPAES